MLFLDRYSRKLLRAINKVKPDVMGYSCVDDIVEYMNTDRKTAILSIKFLEEKGVLYTGKMGENIYSVQITHAGRNRFEFNWIDFKLFLIKSIFTPIAVSIATTLITLAISALL